MAFLFFGCAVSEEDQTKKTALAVLKSSLQHENFFVRSAAIKAIGEMGDPAQIPLIVPGFKDSSPFVRLFSVESAAALHGHNTVKLLLAASSDPDPMVRIAVVKGFNDLANTDGKVDGAPLLKLLEPLLKDPDPTVSLFSFAALAQRGDQQAFAELEKGLAENGMFQSAVVALGRSKQKEAIPLLTKTLDHFDEMIRMFSAEALGEIAMKEAYLPLSQKAADQSASVRGSVATALGKIGDEKAIPILNTLLADPELSVQISAAEGLARMRKPQFAIYEKALHHADYGVRHSTVGSLQKTAGREGLPLLIKALSDEAPRVRIAAVRAIGSIGKKSEVPLLKDRMSDPDLSVRAYAAGNVVRLLSYKKGMPVKPSMGE